MGARESCVRSEGKAKPSSKSSSIVSEDSVVWAAALRVSRALMVETPSSSSSSPEEAMGGRMVNMEDGWDWDVSEEASSDRAVIPAMTA
jgi:hypothetical protein